MSPALTAVIFHCVFNPDGSITHYGHTFEMNVFESMPNLYAVTVVERRSSETVKVHGCFFMVTTATHEDIRFEEVVGDAFRNVRAFKAIDEKRLRFKPARLGNLGGGPPTEKEMLRVALTQYLKFDTTAKA
ncbi:hypothetical protein CAL12_20285 [Bordetella genomosp. 8]|uniref:Uncharacterized protein n=1 Tax=Bordetella genomosp. 8 TaxID=1416806 RepID=A0A1W6YPB1_9BORD|nr:hypothetical protein [Bordetella genomosp. 8]ARP82922.1 hypothetical protein CAL12_20285 [Bordetella genomosp. 8]